ncbi:putative DNA repair protein [Thermochaetoides thermophila DSM 1495]|uniref:Non-structural maintenance of chromosomes element 1 homolog n=1 Tax=Chaetomium thermophilum (strain DSM 1495 / CBS 144.50 / IMI 039719) TaxID=759272 RepID=G0S8A9_CHATD|nr:putative DNA repair protein [Thermochaetoides thermophila DSM 1495]EGS21943.1 putative DNA repair protein [Thermochaetoides thermophila DSM 1495]
MDQDWVPALPPGYNDTNRAFLQAFMARGTLSLSEGQKLIAAIQSASTGEHISPSDITRDVFQHYIHAARQAIEPLDFDIRNTRDQLSGERIWAFVNAHSDPPTQLSTVHTADEVAYIKRLLDAMFDKHNTPRIELMAIDEAEALRLSRPPAQSRQSGVGAGGDSDNLEVFGPKVQPLKHSEVLSLLSSLVQEGWLQLSPNGFYSLTTRALLELWQWLVEAYNDPEPEDNAWQPIKFCEGCKEIVTYGQRCDEPDCLVRLHDHCSEGFWRTRPDRRCPKCNREWSGNHYVGERALTTRAGWQRGRQRGGRRSEPQAEDEDEE